MSEARVLVIRKVQKSLTEVEQAQREEIRLHILNTLQTLVKFPEDVSVVFQQGSHTTVYLIDVRREDFGRILGAKGKTIDSLRIIVTAMSASQGFRSVIQFQDEGKYF